MAQASAVTFRVQAVLVLEDRQLGMKNILSSRMTLAGAPAFGFFEILPL